MKKGLMIPRCVDKCRWRLATLTRSPYLLAALLCYSLIAVVIIVYLRMAPVYSSHMALVLPGSGSSSNFVLDEVGQATHQTKPAFGQSAFNPRVNYKEVLRSRLVRQRAADTLGISLIGFGDPRVELTELTSIIQVYMQDNNAQLAQKKSWALYDAFQNELDRLRADESLRRDNSVSNVLQQYKDRLLVTRQAIVDFQQRGLLLSMEQMQQATAELHGLRERRQQLQAENKNLNQFVNQLGIDLGFTPALAGQALVLQADAEFRGYLQELNHSAAQLAEYDSRWGKRHPRVLAERSRFDSAKVALRVRTTKLVGGSTADALHAMDLQASVGGAEIFSNLVDSYARLQGQLAEQHELGLIEQRVGDRLKVYAREMAELENLQRDHKLAEAVFTQAAARLQAGKADVFASYPVVQLMSPPLESHDPVNPKPKLALVAGILGFLLVTVALVMVWQREKLLLLLLKK